MFRSTIRYTILPVVLLLGLVAAAARVSAQEVPHGYEEGILDVEVPGFTHKIMTAYFRNDTIPYLPLGDVLGILRSRVERSRNGSLYTGHLSGDEEFSINLVNHTLVARDTIVLDTSMYFQSDIDLYVRDTVLAMALGTNVHSSFAELKTTITVSDRLPVVSYIQRRGVWNDLNVVTDSLTQSTLDYTFQRMLLGSASLGWRAHGLYSLNSVQLSHRESFGGSLQLNMPLLYGQFTVGGFADQSTATGQPSTSTINMSGWSWVFTIPDFPLISEFSLLGQTFTRNVGARITNAKMGYRLDVELDTIHGSARGRDVVELYQGQLLIGATKADTNGSFLFVIPRHRGREVFRTVAVNQYGETIEETHTYGNQIITVKPGVFEYTIGATVDSLSSHASGSGNATAMMGLTDWLQVSATAQAVAPEIGQMSFSNDSSLVVTSLTYALRAALLHDVGLDLNYSQLPDIGAISVASSIIPELPISASVSNIRPRHKDSIVSDLTYGLSTGFSTGHFSVYAGGSYNKRQLTFNPGVGVFAGPIALTASASTIAPYPEAGSGGETQVTTGRRQLIPNRLNLLDVQAGLGVGIAGIPRLNFYAAYDHGIGKLSSFEVNTSFSLTQDIGMSITAVVPRQDVSRTYVRIGLDWETGPVTGRTGFVADKTFQQITTAVGGTAYVGGSGIELSRERNRAGSVIRLYAYNDRNGNGEQEDGEEDLPNPMGLLVRNISGDAASQPSDDRGVFWMVPEHEDIIVEVDRWSLAADEYYPTTRRYGVYMAQGFQRSIHVACRRGYTIEGQCAIERPDLKGNKTRTTQGLSSMRIWLEPTVGVGTYDGEMFDDGTLIIMGVPSGEYRIRMDKAQMDYRRVSMRNEGMTVVISEEKPTLPEVILVPITTTETSPSQER